MWLAGDGTRVGHIHGATDELGFAATVDRVHVHGLHALILDLLRFDHDKLTYRYAGRDFRLTDVHGRVVTQLMGVGHRRLLHGRFRPTPFSRNGFMGYNSGADYSVECRKSISKIYIRRMIRPGQDCGDYSVVQP
jgi:hypothetical protein